MHYDGNGYPIMDWEGAHAQYRRFRNAIRKGAAYRRLFRYCISNQDL